VAERKEIFFRGAIRRRKLCQTTTSAGKTGPSPWPVTLQIHLDSTTFVRTSTNGAATGTIPATMQLRRSAIRVARKLGNDAPRAAAPGAITSRSRAVRRVRAFHHNFNMPITGSGWRATFAIRERSSRSDRQAGWGYVASWDQRLSDRLARFAARHHQPLQQHVHQAEHDSAPESRPEV
jgi:hypothetical protein